MPKVIRPTDYQNSIRAVLIVAGALIAAWTGLVPGWLLFVG
jgi:hypothetical protein